MSFDFNRLHGVITQMTELFKFGFSCVGDTFIINENEMAVTIFGNDFIYIWS
jgi:hypothetical protein